MASVQDIATISNYQGNPALGGKGEIGVTIDTTPLERLATFTYYKNRDLWEQKQKKDAMAAQQIANLAAYDITSPLKPYSEALFSKLNEIKSHIRDKDALTYNSANPEPYFKTAELEQQFSRLRKSATASDAVYNAKKNEIDTTADPLKKDALQKDLDLSIENLFKGGVDDAQNKILQSTPELKISEYELPDLVPRSFDVLAKDKNGIYNLQYKYVDIPRLFADANLTAANVVGDKSISDSPEFQKLSTKEQEAALSRERYTQQSKQGLKDLSANLTSMIQQYQQQNPDKDLTQLQYDPNNPSGNTLLDTIASANYFNKMIDEINQLVEQGALKDPTGKVITQKSPKINLFDADGASVADLIALNSLQKNKNSLLDLKKTYTQTDDELQKQKLGLDNDKLKLDKDKWNYQMNGSETVKNGAFERAKRIYKDLEKIAGSDGFISPDEARQLNVEQLKYLGVELPTQRDAEGKVVSSSGLQPLDLTKAAADKFGYGISLNNGEIRVMREAHIRPNGPGKKGTFYGEFDNTKSTNLFNVATNILNEELQKAGSKELNSYMPIDLGTGGVSANTSGGSSSQGGGTSGYSNVKPATYNGKQINIGVKNGKWYNIDTGEEMK